MMDQPTDIVPKCGRPRRTDGLSGLIILLESYVGTCFDPNVSFNNFYILEKSHHGGRELALDRYRIERDRSRRRKMRRWRREQQVRDKL